MKRPLEKLLLLLASSGLSSREVHQIVRELQNVHPNELTELVRLIRYENLRSVKAATSMMPEVTRYLDYGSDRSHGDVELRIERLLRGEAGLSVKDAAIELLSSLAQERPGIVDDLRPPNREALKKWLTKLLRRVEPSELLHHATRIRNRHVHQSDQDWPLRERQP